MAAIGRRDPGLLLFLAVAFRAAWLFALPVWWGDVPLDSPLIAVAGAAMMTAPSLGVLAVWWRQRRARRELPADAPTWRQLTGVTLGPVPRRTVLLTASTWVGVPLLVIVAVA